MSDLLPLTYSLRYERVRSEATNRRYGARAEIACKLCRAVRRKTLRCRVKSPFFNCVANREQRLLAGYAEVQQQKRLFQIVVKGDLGGNVNMKHVIDYINYMIT